MIERATFRAMGTDVELLVDAEGEVGPAFASAQAEFERLEGLLSRFREDSQLSVLNREGSLQAGSDLVRVTQLALEARERTGGRFDPTVLDAVAAAGYDRSFEEISDAVAPIRPSASCGGGVRLDPGTGRIELDPGVRLDFGGIGKGYAVDRACALLAESGPCLVNAGGDLAACGRSWPVGVETAQATMTLELDGGALATSGVDRRRWRTAAGEAHHLIDPANGRPAESDVLRVTVVAPTAVEAEVLAKALFLAGAEQARAEADELEAPCVLVLVDGRTVVAGGLR